MPRARETAAEKRARQQRERELEAAVREAEQDTPLDIFHVPRWLLQGVADYLSAQPYREVAGLLGPLSELEKHPPGELEEPPAPPPET
jgi:hypothetical protein